MCAVAKWMVEKGCAPWLGTECDSCLAAGRCGDTPMLSCLRRLGVPWNEHVLRWAAEEPDRWSQRRRVSKGEACLELASMYMENCLYLGHKSSTAAGP